MKKIAILLIAIMWMELGCSPAHQVSKKPNIVLILADDMGFSDLGCYGADIIKTPNIDQLAEDGIRFTRFYNNAICSPTRASLLTGLYPQQVGMGILSGPSEGPKGPYEGYLNEHCATIAEVLKQAGYTTLMSGKWHVGEHQQYWPTNRGFDKYFGLISGAANYFNITKTKVDTTISKRKITRHMSLNGHPYMPPPTGFYMTSAITNHALKMLDEQGGQDKPFFLYLAYTAPHWPLQALPEDIARYKGLFNEGWDSLRTLRYLRQKKLGILDSQTKLPPRDKAIPAWSAFSGEKRKEMEAKMAVYAAQIYRLDQGVGEIVAKLKSLGKENNTIVIFLSDNGASAEGGVAGFNSRHNGLPPGGENSYMSYGKAWANLSNTPYRYYKKWLHEGGISTPLIVKWPAELGKKYRGRIVTQDAKQSGHVIDLMPTLCELAGAKYPDTLNGKKILPLEGNSLLPLIKGNSKWKRHLPLYWAWKGHKAMLLGNYKIVAVSMDAPWELYNIQNDRSELNDLAKAYPEKVTQMAAMWTKWAEKVGVFSDTGRKWYGGE